MPKKFADVVIVGAGPAGTACALKLLDKGIRPAILEERPFPRYRIGESLTGCSGELLRGLGLATWLASEGSPVKCGTKVFGPQGRNSFWVPVMARDGEDLVPATTWQVRRSRFDEVLLSMALDRGAEYRPARAVDPVVEGERVTGVVVRSEDGTEETLRSEFVVDASGQATFLAQKGVTGPKERGRYDKQIAIFSQVRGALTGVGTEKGNTIIFHRERNHWAWFIPIDDEVVSVGVVVPASYFKDRNLAREDFLRSELGTINPELHLRVPERMFVEDVRATSNYSYHIREFAGPGFLCVGDSHRFVDPIFSFGVHFALHEAAMAAEAIERALSGTEADGQRALEEFQCEAERGQNVTQDMIDCFWQQPLAFTSLVHRSHRDQMIDLFAGRFYGNAVDDMDAVREMRAIVA